MKNLVRILFAAMLCIFIFQTNVDGQISRKAPVNANESAVKVSPNEVAGKVSPNNVASKVSPNNVAGKNTVAELPKNQASTPVTVDKVIDIRSYAGMTVEAFAAKMKSQGYEKSTDDLGMGLSEFVYKSKTTGCYISVNYGAKGNGYFVRTVSKAKDFKNPDLPTLKKTFLDYSKQCTDLKAAFKKGEVNSGDEPTSAPLRVKISAEWISKCLPELDKFVNAKHWVNAYQTYGDAGYTYSISFSHNSGLTYLVVEIADLTVLDNRG